MNFYFWRRDEWLHRIYVGITVGILFTCFSVSEVVQAQSNTDFQPPANRKMLPGAELQHPTRTRKVNSEDKGDYYLQNGKKVLLLRASDEIAVQYKGSLTVDQGFRVLKNAIPAGKAIERQKTLRSKHVDIICSKPEKGGPKATTSELHQYIKSVPQVSHTYPVFINPKDNLRIVAFDEILLCLEGNTDIQTLTPLLNSLSASAVRKMDAKNIPVYLIKLSDLNNTDALSASVQMSKWPGVQWAEPNFLTEIKLSFVPNDPKFNQQQSLNNTGLNGALNNADVDAPEAWDLTRGDASIVIAIIDDGVDTSHADLSIQPGGYDFADNDTNPSPVGPNGHGTGCAGIVAAIGNNNRLISGIAPDCKILPIKIIDDDGIFTTDQIIGDAIRYAADNADILSNSWGGGLASSYISSAIDYAVNHGRDGLGSAVFVATGNSASIWDQGGGRIRVPMNGLSGNYYFSFYYEKDESYSIGLDAALIDNVCFIESDGYTHSWREDFEGTFPPAGWTRSGNANWYQTTSNSHTGTGGTKSVRSGAITHNQGTTLTTPIQAVTGSETLAFSLAVSSEFGYDFFSLDVYDESRNYVGSYGPFSGEPYVVTAPSFPASYPSAIAVGSSTDRDLRSDYSQYGATLDFVAPSNGGWNDIIALDPSGSVGWTDTNFKPNFGGTSSACPLAAGIAALMLSLDPSRTVSEIREAMYLGCDKIGGVAYSGGEPELGGWNEQYGYGRINAQKALMSLDDAGPTITLIGNASLNVECGTTYIDAGATATDLIDGDVTSSIVVSNPVNTSVPGSYTVRYNASDSSSNPADEVTRTVNVVDTTSPVITLLGSASLTVECGAAYVDAGATATDTCAGNLTSSIVTSNMTNTSVLGRYTVRYNVADPWSNTAVEVTRTVDVVDTTAPILTLFGDQEITLYLCPDDPVTTLPGATAMDVCEGNLTSAVLVGGDTVSTTPGTYVITYNISDSSSNAAVAVTRTVTVEAVTGTNIFLESTGVPVECGDTFDIPVGYVRDGCNESFAEATINGTVDTLIPGDYTVIYAYTDVDPITLTFTVQDTIAPVITLLGEAEVTIQSGDDYTDAGARADDSCDGDLTAAIEVVGDTIDTTVPGTYVVSYNVKDTALNKAIETKRIVNILDTKPFVSAVTVETENTVLITFNKKMNTVVTDPSKYSIAGTGQGSLPATPTSVELVSENTYRLIWEDCSGIMRNGGDITVTVAENVLDNAGNTMIEPLAATDVGGGISVLPEITVIGENPLSVECGTNYADPGATAVDACNTDLTTSIEVINPVDTMIVGEYAVCYNVTDAAGNTAAEKTRTVNVVDTMPPTITITGNKQIVFECGDMFTYPETSASDSCEGNLGTVQTTLAPDASGLTAWYWALDETNVPLWVDEEPLRYDYGSLPKEGGRYLLIYIATNNAEATYPTLDEKGLPPIFDSNGDPDFLNEQGEVTVDFARLVDIVDTLPPFISMEGESEIVIDCNTPYVEPGVRATDYCEGDLTGNIVTEGTVNTNVAGVYTLTYRVTDQSGKSDSKVRTVTVNENLPPVFTLEGDAVMTIECGDTYEEPGVTALDDCDGDLTADIQVGGDTVNTLVPATYVITYDASDRFNNAAQATRTVTVADKTRPVVTLLGDTEVRIEYGGEFSDPGATAYDSCDGDLSDLIIIQSDTIDTSVPGGYSINYSVTDSAGNQNNSIRQIVVSGPETVAVPDVKGLSTEEAQEILAALMLQMNAEEEAYHESIEAGLIISQTPMAGSSILEGSTVTVVVSKGPAPLTEGEPTEQEPETREEIAAVLLEQFDSLDTVDDGLASIDEVLAILPSLTIQQFNELDANGDSYISRDELLAITEGEKEECTGCRAYLGCCEEEVSEKNRRQHHLGDWLLLGISLLALMRFSRENHR